MTPHLINTFSNPVYINKNVPVYFIYNTREGEYKEQRTTFRIRLPLTTPFPRLVKGFIDVSIGAPQEYAWPAENKSDVDNVKPLVQARVYHRMCKYSDVEEDIKRIMMLQDQLHNANLGSKKANLSKPIAHNEMPEPLITSDGAPVSVSKTDDPDPDEQNVDIEQPPKVLIAGNVAADQEDDDNGKDYFVDDDSEYDHSDKTVPLAGPKLNLLISSGKSKFAKRTITGRPPYLKSETLTRLEKDALLADNDQISYAAGVIIAKAYNDTLAVMGRQYNSTKELQPVYKWLDKGLDTCIKSFNSIFETLPLGDNYTFPEAIYMKLGYRKVSELMAETKNETDIYNATAFNMGIYAFYFYRMIAAKDEAWFQRSSGRRINTDAACKGFRDYFEHKLTQGLQYSESLAKRRMVKVFNCNEELLPSTGYDNNGEPVVGFKPAEAFNPVTKCTENLDTAIQRNLHIPPKTTKKGQSGKVLLSVVVEADGAISMVTVISSPSSRLSCAATDAVYRTYMQPATVNFIPVAYKMTISVSIL